MSIEVLTEESFPTTTIETMTTKFRVICTDTIANFEAFDIFSDSSDLSNRFMARDQGELKIN
jgi:hypothetical protein